MLTRLIAATLFLFLTATSADAARYADQDRELARIVKGKGPTDPIAAAAVAVMVGDRLVYSGAAGCAEFAADKCLRHFLPTTKFRVASISKMALAMGIKSLVEDGRLDLDQDASGYLGWPFSNPYFPGRPITTRHLLSHRSTIRDPEEYWVPAPGDFRSLFETDEKPFALPAGGPDIGPGGWFTYANLNYGVLAGVIEGVTKERFDHFMTKTVFKPAGLDIGYNWSGVSKEGRAAGASLPSRENRQWMILLDPPETLRGDLPDFRAEEGPDRAAYLAGYAPGENPTLFSPQGGLRASVEDLVNLVRLLKDDALLSPPVWRYDDARPNGDTEEGFYDAFGLGVQTVEGSDKLLTDLALIGHAGEAYGVYSGAWLIKADRKAGRPEDIAFAFAATGVNEKPEQGDHPTFNAIEQRLVRVALTAATGHRGDDDPRPFDSGADAGRDVDAALLAARATGKKPLIILGTNSCHDSRALAKKFATPPLDAIIAQRFLPVWVDVGLKDRNLDIARRFGVEKIIGTPTVLIMTPEGEVLNADTAAGWRTAESRSFEDALAYFGSFAMEKP